MELKRQLGARILQVTGVMLLPRQNNLIVTLLEAANLTQEVSITSWT